MKIVFNTDQIHLHGGIEKVMTTKANYFVNLPGVEVYIITTDQNNKPPCYELDQRVKVVDLDVNYNRAISYLSKENIVKAIKHYRSQKKLFKSLKPDVIISPNYNFDHYWLPLLKRGAILIKERHNSRFFENQQREAASLLSSLKFKIKDSIERLYNYIIVLNKDEAKYVYTGNAVVIPNPIHLREEIVELSHKQVIAVGRIAPVKGFDHLIEAWKSLRKRFPDWELHIYGPNYLDTQEDLQKKIEEYNLENVVKFKGEVSEVYSVLPNYSIYVLTSVTECFPTVLLESLSVGLPVVSYDCPNGPRNIIVDKEDGLLVKNQNVEDLIAKLSILMGDEQLRVTLGRSGKQNIKRYSVDNVMKRWEKLLCLSS